MFIRVSAGMYLDMLEYAQRTSQRVREATTPAADMDLAAASAFIAVDGESGYAVKPGGELVGVFSTVKGRGEIIVRDAIENGATHLDCFDGYLPTLYGRHGFVETSREANWAPGGPDVVYMALEA
jgi:hypothetical protein